ncbi:hypothetical protein NL108_017624 [Boleophthalmus pectinirostris]|nr:hypothetical protein NL108_017624 [Boleophthalmus pectinirostris]
MFPHHKLTWSCVFVLFFSHVFNTHTLQFFSQTVNTLFHLVMSCGNTRSVILCFDTQNLPFTTQNLPFTTQNLPFTTQNLPFTTQNLPFTTQNLPFTTQNLPFTTQNLPFTKIY